MANELTFQERLAKNNGYYDQFAAEVARRTESRDFSRAYEAFQSRLPKSGTILDIGCGAGQHLKYFSQLGRAALGIEPSAGMRKLALQAGVHVIEGAFETLDVVSLPDVAGVWCAASLLHVPANELEGVLQKIHHLLQNAGPLFFTVRLGDGAKWDRFDDRDGIAERYMQMFSETELERILDRAGFHVAEKWTEDSTWGRPCRWISMVALPQIDQSTSRRVDAET